MNPTFDSRTAGLVLVALGWALCLVVIGSPEILLFTAPVFLLAAPLALGRYTGETLIAAASRKIRARRPESGGESKAAGSRLARLPFAVSLIIASNLAGRAPPALAA